MSNQEEEKNNKDLIRRCIISRLSARHLVERRRFLGLTDQVQRGGGVQAELGAGHHGSVGENTL